MNRNSIRAKVRMTTCCLAGAIMISGSSFVSNAAVTAGAANLAAVTSATEEQNTNPVAGVSLSLSNYLADENQKSDKEDTEKTDTEKTDKKEDTTQVAKNETPVVKSEYADIGVSVVEEYVNIRSASNTDSEVVGKLYSNSAVTVLGEEGDFYKIHSGNCEGYIKKDYIATGNEELAKSIGTRVAVVSTENLNIRNDVSTDAGVIGQVTKGDILLVEEELDGWIKVSTDEGSGFISAEFADSRTHYKVAESVEEEAARLAKAEEARLAAEEVRNQAAARENAKSNTSSASSTESSSNSSSSGGGSSKNYTPPSGGSGSSVVSYASQFVGNPYVYGGTSLTNGADCSGFIMSVYAAFGVGLPHSSSGMRSVGYEVSQSEMQPGDIICYNGHVAIYAGGDTIVHASTPETGIKYSSPAAYKSIITVRRIF